VTIIDLTADGDDEVAGPIKLHILHVLDEPDGGGKLACDEALDVPTIFLLCNNSTSTSPDESAVFLKPRYQALRRRYLESLVRTGNDAAPSW
jgi:hypothetical protein